jgi:hypothetical protein
VGVYDAVTTSDRVRIEYHPWIRHHRVEFSPEAGKPPIVSYVHESFVPFWQPLDLEPPAPKKVTK